MEPYQNLGQDTRADEKIFTGITKKKGRLVRISLYRVQLVTPTTCKNFPCRVIEGDRTLDLRSHNPMLHQLSYNHHKFAVE